jgi:hypothetical protein
MLAGSVASMVRASHPDRTPRTGQVQGRLVALGMRPREGAPASQCNLWNRNRLFQPEWTVLSGALWYDNYDR